MSSARHIASRWEAAVVTALLALLSGYILFAPPIVGLATSGDFARETGAVGLHFPAELPPSDYYFNYLIGEWDYAPGSGQEAEFKSSHTLLTRLALAISVWDATPYRFDIRYLGFVQWLLLIGLTYAACRSFAGLRPVARYVLSGLLVLMWTDTGYLAYFHSFYFESATWLFGIATAVAGVFLVWRLGWSELAAFCGAAALFVSAKRQNTPLALLILFFLLLLAVKYVRVRPRWSMGVLAGAALVGAAAYYVFTTLPQEVRRRNAYQFVAITMLPHSPDIDGDLRALGLGERVKEALGENVYIANSPYDDGVTVPESFGRTDIIWLFVAKPERLYTALVSQARFALKNHLVHLGMFEKRAGRAPKARWGLFRWWDAVRASLANVLLLVGFGLLHGAVFCWAAWRLFAGPDSVMTRLLLLQGLGGGLAVAGYITGVLGDGNEVLKHLFLLNVWFDICLLGGVAWAFAAWDRLHGDGGTQGAYPR